MKTMVIFVIYFPWAEGSCSVLSQTSYEATGWSPVMKTPCWCFLQDFVSHPRLELPLWLNSSLSPIPWKYHDNVCHRYGVMCGRSKSHWSWQQGDSGIHSAPKFLFPTCPVPEIPVYLQTVSSEMKVYSVNIPYILLRNESTGLCRLQ